MVDNFKDKLQLPLQSIKDRFQNSGFVDLFNRVHHHPDDIVTEDPSFMVPEAMPSSSFE